MKFSNIALISSGIRALVIGGGKAGLIKTKALLKRGCTVFVVSNNFIEGFNDIDDKNLHLIKGYYKKDYIFDKHLIVMAIGEDSTIQAITTDCNENHKLYLNCKNFKEGNFIIPFQVESKEVNIAINTTEGNPKVSKKISNVFLEYIEERDELISFINFARTRLKDNPIKNEVLDFLVSDEFERYFKEGKHRGIIIEKYGEILT